MSDAHSVSPQSGQHKITSVELIGMIGLSLYIGWLLLVFFWLGQNISFDIPINLMNFAQLVIFAGEALMFIALHFLGKIPSFNPFALPLPAITGACAILYPVVTLIFGIPVNVFVVLLFFASALAGIASAMMKVYWLDVCSRLGFQHYGRFIGIAAAAGTVLFFVAVLLPADAQAVFAIVYIICSVGFVLFSTDEASGNKDRAPLEAVEQESVWRFTKEIEPSLIIFGMIFAFTFLYLFDRGLEHVMIGMVGVLIGSMVAALFSSAGKAPGITTIQRTLVFITVLVCVLMPFVPDAVRAVLSILITFSCAFLLVSNSSFIVKKAVLLHTAPLFRMAPQRFAVFAIGFTLGWALASVLMLFYGLDDDVFKYARLALAVILVAVVMTFFPVEKHHNSNGSNQNAEEGPTTIVNVTMSEQELFEARCQAISKLYQLSPRESEVLPYLAKGRNTAYLQEKFTFSPHTAKSHIYNIYRKLDIHSQQKLMDFVEEFPVDSIL